MSYQYDQYERLKSVKIGDKTVCTNIYDGEGRLYRQITPECPEGIQYHYDTLGRLTGLGGQAELRITYDGVNRMDSLTTVADGKSLKTQYVYGTEKNNKSQIKEIRVNGTTVLSYGTDGLQRRISQTYQDAGGYQTTWEYKAGPSGNTTILPEKMTNGSSSLEYQYDAMNNITEIRENGTLIQSYAYDGQNQLVRENDVRKNETVTYAYDTGGNILTKKHYAYTTGSLEGKTPVSTDSYGYQNSGWKDLLTSYNGAPITYDGSGNATKWTGGRTFTWEAGKRLSGIQGGEGEVSYTYDVDGNRTSKTVGGEKTEYVLNGSQILSMKKGKERLDFLYDENSSLMGLEYNGTRYYYIRNAQLDIIGIIDRTGKQVVSYQYDAWGKVLPTTGELKWTVGVANPFRYRGYYYDQESGLYYLQNRYYDPVVGRFISPEPNVYAGGFDSGAGLSRYNVYAYCANNPVNFSDPTGEFILTALLVGVVTGAVIGGAVGGTVAYNSAKSTGLEGSDLFRATVGGVGKGALIGGVGGGLVGGTVGVAAVYGVTSVAGTAMITATSSIAARATEVTVLQIKKSSNEGYNGWQIANNCIDSVYSNGGKIMSPIGTKTVFTVGSYGLSVLKNKGTSLGLNTFLKSSRNKILPYGATLYAWWETARSIFSRDPVARANRRGYFLK